MEKTSREVSIVSHGIDITSIYPEKRTLVENMIPTGCPSNELRIEFQYLPHLSPLQYVAVCTNVDKGSEICRHCILNPTGTHQVNFDL